MAALASGTAAPAFDLPGTDGKSHALKDLADRDAAVLVFTCNHCPYAKAWEGRLLDIAREYESRGVGFMLIGSNDPVQYPEDSFEEMTVRARDRGYPFPYLFDETQSIARAYGAERTPEVFVFDAGRELRYHGAVDDDQDEQAVSANYLRDALDAVLAGETPAVSETPPVGCTIKWK
jgi:peroxiredoxin